MKIRGLRWPFVLLFLGACGISMSALGASPPPAIPIPSEDPGMQRDLQSLSQAISAVPNGSYKSSSMTLGGLTVDSITVNNQATLKGNLTFSPSTKGIVGTTTNDSATAGNVGEYIEGIGASQNTPANGVYGDATSISLSSGDWDVSALAYFQVNTANWTVYRCGISSTSGNDGTGLTLGTNESLTQFVGNQIANSMCSVPVYRVSISGTTTYYLKVQSTFSAGQPQVRGRLSARRVR